MDLFGLSDDEEEAIIIAMFVLSRRRRRYFRERKTWVHPLTAERLSVGQYHTIMHRLRQDDGTKFFDYFRMSQDTFDELLDILRPHIEKKDTTFRKSISAEERLAITLRYLATGCTFQELHFYFRVGASTASKIVNEVCAKIWQHLHELCIPELEHDDWLKIADGIYARSQFPNCIGAIDGKHIRMIQPGATGSEYYNYKSYFSMVLLGICDADCKFTFIDVGSYGSAADSAIYKHSKLYAKLSENTLNLPNERPISSQGDPLPFVFIGDEAFGLSNHMLRPYGGKWNEKYKRVFNYRLCRARRLIECAFGILANKWRILRRELNVKVDIAEAIIKACCLLHNFVREREGKALIDIDIDGSDKSPSGLNSGFNPVRGGGQSAVRIREDFAHYFSNEGAIDWQYKHI